VANHIDIDTRTKSEGVRVYGTLAVALGLGLLLGVVVYLFPALLLVDIGNKQAQNSALAEFPVTVDPAHKIIAENPQVDALLASPASPLEASAGGAADVATDLLTAIATDVVAAPWYQSIAAVNGRFVTIAPGLRKEQVAAAFGSALDWSDTQKEAFLTPAASSTLPLPEGSYAPGTYFTPVGTTPAEAQQLVDDEFTRDVLSHYSSSTAAVVPLNQALTVASLIEREAGSASDMRLISGVIWNRLFNGMDLQIDATLQYAKASKTTTGSWWPAVVPKDKSIKSAYNTYQHAGLPPGPIATPSVAAVLAALNPVNTSCLFYFHDKAGGFHCSDTYAEHVALLKQYYGQGK
jgi:UPF0755 protein